MKDQNNMTPNNNPGGYALDKLTSRLAAIEERNKRVQADKAWEASWARRGLLILFTYLAIGLYLSAINVTRPWLNAIVPSLGFLLSTLTLPFFKQLWLKRWYKG
jgi:hypothetical protein